MKKAILLPVFLLFKIGFLSAYKQKTVQNFLPVNLVFVKPLPPDSIREFVKAYLQINKIETIDWKQGIELWGKKSKDKMLELINSKKFNEETAKNITSLIGPVYNILAIEIFSDSTNTEYYKIDSIRYTITIMFTDTSRKKKVFIPSKNNKNPFIPLKAFTDEVLASGLLK